MARKVVAAAVHAAPVFMNKSATLKKVVDLIEKAGKESIELLVFPETFVPGYPVCFPVSTTSPAPTKDRLHSTSSNATHQSNKSAP